MGCAPCRFNTHRKMCKSVACFIRLTNYCKTNEEAGTEFLMGPFLLYLRILFPSLPMQLHFLLKELLLKELILSLGWQTTQKLSCSPNIGPTVGPFQHGSFWKEEQGSTGVLLSPLILQVSPCIFDPHGRAGICGDWLLGSSLEAAALSGIALANQIADYLRSGGAHQDEFAVGLRNEFQPLREHDTGQFPGLESKEQTVGAQAIPLCT